MMKSKLGIYIHIPFCESKCAYCDFASFVLGEDKKKEYFDALIREIKNSNCRGREVDTIYFGGGTPSSVNYEYIEEVLNCLRNNFKVEKNAEITIEANPNSANFSILQAYFNMGINRISFGVQALDDEALKELGRRHNSKEALEVISNAQKVGFKNISADLMLGIPKMDLQKTLEGAAKLIDTGVTHISSYMLQVEEGTLLSKRVNENFEYLPSEDETIDIYEKVVAFLERRGFTRYEVSNFAKDGYESRHNLKYWAGEDYIGVGLAASSYVDGQRFTNARTFEKYYAGEKQVEVLTKENIILEKIMLGLRCRLGFKISEIQSQGFDVTKNASFNEYINRGIIVKEGDIVRLNPQYYGVNNLIITSLIDGI